MSPCPIADNQLLLLIDVLRMRPQKKTSHEKQEAEVVPLILPYALPRSAKLNYLSTSIMKNKQTKIKKQTKNHYQSNLLKPLLCLLFTFILLVN